MYKPIKKDESGIWAIQNSTVMQDKIYSVIPRDAEVIVNSGRGRRINVSNNADVSDSEYGISFNIEQEAKKVGITEASKYYGTDLDFLIYEYETPRGKTAYLFIFEGTDLVLCHELETQEDLQRARNVLIALERHSRD